MKAGLQCFMTTTFPIFDLAKVTAEAFAGPDGESEVVSDPSISNNGGFPRMSNERIKTDLGFTPKYGDPYRMMKDYHNELERGDYVGLFA